MCLNPHLTKKVSRYRDSNSEPDDYKSTALPIELYRHLRAISFPYPGQTNPVLTDALSGAYVDRTRGFLLARQVLYLLS